MKEVIKTYEKKIYVASDGKEFDSEEWCLEHEDELDQKREEEEIERDLGIKTHADYPSLLNTENMIHDYKLFLIKNEEDLDRFIDVFSYWFSGLRNMLEVDKTFFAYPEVLLILDFPRGGDRTRLYKVSRLGEQFNAFADEINHKINQEKAIEGLDDLKMDYDNLPARGVVTNDGTVAKNHYSCNGRVYISYEENRLYAVRCENCGVVEMFKTTSLEDAILHWNTRPEANGKG